MLSIFEELGAVEGIYGSTRDFYTLHLECNTKEIALPLNKNKSRTKMGYLTYFTYFRVQISRLCTAWGGGRYCF